MKKIQHEKINVLQPCLKVCKSLQAKGVILYHRRMSEFEWYHVPGDADIRIELLKGNTLWLILCECKRDDGKGTQRKSQKKIQKRYDPCHNAVYILVEDAKELEDLIMKITGWMEQQKKEINSLDFEP